jgi:hypothetical protein
VALPLASSGTHGGAETPAPVRLSQRTNCVPTRVKGQLPAEAPDGNGSGVVGLAFASDAGNVSRAMAKAALAQRRMAEAIGRRQGSLNIGCSFGSGSDASTLRPRTTGGHPA